MLSHSLEKKSRGTSQSVLKVKCLFVWCFFTRNSPVRGTGMARVNDGSHILPATHTFIHKWNEPHLPTPQPQSITALWPVLIFHPSEGRRLSWLIWVAGYKPRWFIRPQTVTHPSTNRRVTSLIETNSIPLSQAATHGVRFMSTRWFLGDGELKGDVLYDVVRRRSWFLGSRQPGLVSLQSRTASVTGRRRPTPPALWSTLVAVQDRTTESNVDLKLFIDVRRVKWRHSNLWPQNDLCVVEQCGVCKIKWRYVASFE